MEAQSTKPKIVGPKDGKAGTLGSIGVRFMIDGDEVPGESFSLVEHPMPPRALAAPLHKHSREDEYSFVLEGRMGALLGDEVVYAEPGDLVFKPREQWHTFWNAGDGHVGSWRSSPRRASSGSSTKWWTSMPVASSTRRSSGRSRTATASRSTRLQSRV